jgi:transcriptional regulator with XRE-family HTH domain
MAKGIIDCRRLKGLMVEKGITIRELSNKIGISENSLAQKINGHRDWWYRELIFIVKEFGFSEVRDVFPELYNSVLTKEAM